MSFNKTFPNWRRSALMLLLLIIAHVVQVSPVPHAQEASGPALPIKQFDTCGITDIDKISSSTYGLGNILVFFRTCADGKIGLWSSDGTTAGTLPIMVLPGEFVSFVTTLGTTLVFGMQVGNSSQLWKTDGTPEGTTQFLSIDGDQETGISTGSPLRVGGLVYFYVSRLYIVQFTIQQEVWRSDGTGPGTFLLTEFSLPANIQPRITTQIFEQFPAYIRMARLNNTLLIADGLNLWRSDGTPETTRLVRQLPQHTWIYLDEALNGHVLLIEYRNSGLQMTKHIWQTDGTASGTTPLGIPAAEDFPRYTYEPLPLVGAQFFFNGAGNTLWSSNGTPQCTFQLAQIPPGAYRYSEGRNSLLIAIDSHSSDQLWKSDGTVSGTTPVSELPASIELSITHIKNDIHLIMLINQEEQDTPNTILSFWRTDGTAGGTTPIQEGLPLWNPRSQAISTDDAVYFWTGSPSGTSVTLWKLPRSAIVSDATPTPSPEPGPHRMMLPLVADQC